MPRSFALGDHFEHFIEEQLRSGRYNNASEVVRAGLRMLEDDAAMRAQKIEDIRRSIEANRVAGDYLTEDEVFSPLEVKYGAGKRVA